MINLLERWQQGILFFHYFLQDKADGNTRLHICLSELLEAQLEFSFCVNIHCSMEVFLHTHREVMALIQEMGKHIS